MQTVERRKTRRYKASYGMYAVVGPDASRLGQIRDISMGGLAFKYLADEARSESSDEMDIIIRQSTFCIKHLPIRTISDVELAKENAFSTVKLRRQGVQFGELTSNQVSQLKYLLKNHTSWTEESS